MLDSIQDLRNTRAIQGCENPAVADPTPLVAGTQVCGNLAESAAREWLVPDGRGGYAMGTVSGLRVRRYHALQVVAGTSGSRRVGLVSLDPVLVTAAGGGGSGSGGEIRLATHEWASGAIAPEGHRLLETFTLDDGLPRWRWRVGGTVVERELATVHGRPALGVVHRLVAGGPIRLCLDALCTWREAHGTRVAADGDLVMTSHPDGVVVEDAYRLSGPNWRPTGTWWRDAWLREEAARGLGASEDLWFAGSFSADLRVGEAIEVSCWADDLDDPPPPAATAVAAERDRIRVLTNRSTEATSARLAIAADAFVVRNADTGAPDVIAGYPWFGSWSRDTMLSYEGLFLATGRADEGRELLRAYAGTLSEGMLANTADTGAVEYNTADGTLWFVHAIGRHVGGADDPDLAAELMPSLAAIIRAHLDGTRYGIRVDPADGLLAQGANGVALTWMDARVDGVPVTARRGKAVEINALWINALGTAADLARRLGRDDTEMRQRFDAATAAFRGRFPAPHGWLFDVVDGPDGDDASLRPNQLLAYSLPHGPLRGERPPEALTDALLTPLGLRTLTPSSQGYRAEHRGTPAQRDAAYHQGTVWPWLIGPFHDAHAAAGAADDPSTADPASLLAGLIAHLDEAGLGSVSETADGSAPHHTTGCPFQAWSVAEATRVHGRGRS